MAKCDNCKKNIENLVLGKIKGTYLKTNNKLFKVCNSCQKQHSISDLKKKLK